MKNKVVIVLNNSIKDFFNVICIVVEALISLQKEIGGGCESLSLISYIKCWQFGGSRNLVDMVEVNWNWNYVFSNSNFKHTWFHLSKD